MDHWTKENSHNKKKKNLDTLGAHDRCVQSLGALRDPLQSRCLAGKHMQHINEEPVDPDWEYPDALLTGHLLHHPKSFVHSLKGSSLCAQLYER